LARCPASIDGERVRKIALTFLGLCEWTLTVSRCVAGVGSEARVRGRRATALSRCAHCLLVRGWLVRVFQKPPPLLSEYWLPFMPRAPGVLGCRNSSPLADRGCARVHPASRGVGIVALGNVKNGLRFCVFNWTIAQPALSQSPRAAACRRRRRDRVAHRVRGLAIRLTSRKFRAALCRLRN
jgi:hypothetical protein